MAKSSQYAFLPLESRNSSKKAKRDKKQTKEMWQKKSWQRSWKPAPTDNQGLVFGISSLGGQEPAALSESQRRTQDLQQKENSTTRKHSRGVLDGISVPKIGHMEVDSQELLKSIYSQYEVPSDEANIQPPLTKKPHDDNASDHEESIAGSSESSLNDGETDTVNPENALPQLLSYASGNIPSAQVQSKPITEVAEVHMALSVTSSQDSLQQATDTADDTDDDSSNEEDSFDVAGERTIVQGPYGSVSLVVDDHNDAMNDDISNCSENDSLVKKSTASSDDDEESLNSNTELNVKNAYVGEEEFEPFTNISNASDTKQPDVDDEKTLSLSASHIVEDVCHEVSSVANDKNEDVTCIDVKSNVTNTVDENFHDVFYSESDLEKERNVLIITEDSHDTIVTHHDINITVVDTDSEKSISFNNNRDQAQSDAATHLKSSHEELSIFPSQLLQLSTESDPLTSSSIGEVNQSVHNTLLSSQEAETTHYFTGTFPQKVPVTSPLQGASLPLMQETPVFTAQPASCPQVPAVPALQDASFPLPQMAPIQVQNITVSLITQVPSLPQTTAIPSSQSTSLPNTDEISALPLESQTSKLGVVKSGVPACTDDDPAILSALEVDPVEENILTSDDTNPLLLPSEKKKVAWPVHRVPVSKPVVFEPWMYSTYNAVFDDLSHRAKETDKEAPKNETKKDVAFKKLGSCLSCCNRSYKFNPKVYMPKRQPAKGQAPAAQRMHKGVLAVSNSAAAGSPNDISPQDSKDLITVSDDLQTGIQVGLKAIGNTTLSNVYTNYPIGKYIKDFSVCFGLVWVILFLSISISLFADEQGNRECRNNSCKQNVNLFGVTELVLGIVALVFEIIDVSLYARERIPWLQKNCVSCGCMMCPNCKCPQNDLENMCTTAYSFCPKKVRTIMDLIRVFMLDFFFYPALIVSSFQFIVDNALDGKIEVLTWILTLIGFTGDLLGVYLIRIFIMFGSVFSLAQTRNKGVVQASIFLLSFIFYSIGNMIVQIMMIIAIGSVFEEEYLKECVARVTNSSSMTSTTVTLIPVPLIKNVSSIPTMPTMPPNDQTCKNASLSVFDIEYAPSMRLMYMIICGFLIPLLSTIMFFMVHKFWSYELPLDTIADIIIVYRQNENILTAPGAVKDVSDEVKVKIFPNLFRDLKKFKETDFINKLFFPFFSPLQVIVCFCYVLLLCIFMGCSAWESGWTIFNVVALIWLIAVNMYAFSVVALWLIIAAIVIMIVVFVVTCICMSNCSESGNNDSPCADCCCDLGCGIGCFLCNECSKKF